MTHRLFYGLTPSRGGRDYPVQYEYDYAGRMKTMTTWTNYASSSGAAVTTWNYHAQRGWLQNKRYADGLGPDYTYTPGGRLKTRSWARTGTGGARILTTYSYGFDDALNNNQHADLVKIEYANDPQTTPAVTYTHDRRGRERTLVRNGMTTTLSYNDANQTTTEAHAGGTLGGLTLTTGYDDYLRRNSLSLNTQPSAVSFSYAYDDASRLQTVTMGSQSATYSYVANSPLVGQIVHKQSGSSVMTTTKSFDLINRLTSISSTAAGSTVASGYQYNSANQRVRNTQADGSYWIYEYDPLGQVRAGRKLWPDGTPVAGQQFEYTHDDIGNRRATKSGGDENGANLRQASYTPNSLNQYSSRSVTGAVQVTGISFATNSVLVNGQTAYRKGEYFWKELLTNNSPGPVWMTIGATATNQTPVSGNVFLPKTPEIFGHDPDGNMTNDGRFVYTWDAENRLVRAESLASGPQNSKRKVTWEFDGKGRRIRQTTYDGTTGTYVLTEDLKFVSDGWRHIAELNASNNVLLRSYLWGLDLSGTLDGAGGVGGLLLVNSAANGAHFTCYDGNGNVAALVSAASAAVTAKYEYGPFGEVLRATGPMAKANPFRFSTKYQDDETDLLYYGYRYYNASTGRWLSRDPIGDVAFSLTEKLNKESLDAGNEALIQQGRDYIRRKDKAGFYRWLEDLELRKVAGIAPYDKKDPSTSETDVFIYVFNRNDAVNRTDYLGLRDFHFPFLYGCVSPKSCSAYVCSGTILTHRIFPRHPLDFKGCVDVMERMMLLGCVTGNFPAFQTGCKAVQTCADDYW